MSQRLVPDVVQQSSCINSSFGAAVALDGSYAVIGAPADSTYGEKNGAAYVFSRSSSANFSQSQKLFQSDPAAGDAFGTAVAISGEWILVGSYLDDDDGSASGSAYFFRLDATTGNFTQTQKITAVHDAFPFDEFGIDVAIDGTWAIVGAPFNDDQGSSSGSVYAFRFNSTSGVWNQTQKIVQPSGAAGDQFGVRVSISGTWAIVTANTADIGGAAFFLRRNTSTGVWTHHSRVIPDDIAASDNFGISTAISGARAVVGARGSDTQDTDAGAAYAYHYNASTDTWNLTTKLLANDGESKAFFGRSVGIYGTTAVVGAYGFDAAGQKEAGATYLFEYRTNSREWKQSNKFYARSGATAFTYFGFAVAVGAEYVFGGAYRAGACGTAFANMLPTPAPSPAPTPLPSHSLSVSPTVQPSASPTSTPTTWEYWVESDMLVESTATYFGLAVAVSGNRAVIGGKYEASASVFTRSGGAWSLSTWLTPPNPDATTGFGEAVAISGNKVIVGAYQDNAGGSRAGAAHIFALFDGNWTHSAKLLASDAAASDWFGYSVSIDGDLAIVGAYKDHQAGGAGDAYIFALSDGNWSQTSKLPSDAANGDRFGYAVAISSDAAFVGAYQDDDVTTNAGVVFAYTNVEGNWSRMAKLTASDATGSEYFGWSVCICGDRAVVGAPGDTIGGSKSGSAYVWALAGGVWSQVAKLTGADGAESDYFGRAVSCSGSVAIVGARGDDDGGSSSGSAYIFALSNGTWSQISKLTGSSAAAADYFGSSVAITNRAALVGAYGDDGGAVYVFDVVNATATPTQRPSTSPTASPYPTVSPSRQLTPAPTPSLTGMPTVSPSHSSTPLPSRSPSGSPTPQPTTSPTSAPTYKTWIFWPQEDKLTASDAASGDYFGASVSIDGDTAIVGARYNNDGGTNSGSVYIFTLVGSTWSQTAKLVASDASAQDQFGWTVSIHGDTAVVGAPYDDDGGGDSGSAYIFTLSGSTWSQTSKLTAADAAASDIFGESVSICGKVVIVGASNDDDGGSWSGSAYIFTLSAGNWTQTIKLIAADAAASDYFGYSVSISSNTAIVGAHGNDDDGDESGSAYIFALTNGTWSQTAKLTASDAAAQDQFGWSVSISGDTAVVGAPYDNDESGSAYVYTLSDGSWTQAAHLTASDGALDDRLGFSVCISGHTVVASAPYDDDDSGSAYVFSLSDGNWSETTKITAADAAIGDYFGRSVSLSGDVAVLGAHFDDDGSSNSGSAYIFSGADVTDAPTAFPSTSPTSFPTAAPSTTLSHSPTAAPSATPSHNPSSTPTHTPSTSPSSSPTFSPTADFTHFSDRLVISSAADRAESVYTADLDNDGDTDVLSASYNDNTVAWYANDDQQNFTQHIITSTAAGAAWVHAADVDGDGDADVLSAAFVDDTVSWFASEIVGSGNVTFTEHVVSSTVNGAVSALGMDVDDDGDMDVVSAAYDANAVYWHENDGAQSFTDHIITSAASGALSVFAIDVDSDGDVDVLSASLWDDTVAWHENNGTEGFTRHVISTAADEARSVYAVDVDGDGDVDVLSASRLDNTVAWYENDGESNFTTRVISDSATSARSVFAVDLDADGDVDVLSALQGADAVEWYENDGSQGFVSHRITESANGARSVYAADVDGDGDVDVLSASYDDDTVAWYRSVGVNTLSPSVSPSSSPSASPSVLPTSAPTYQTWPYWLPQQSVTASDVAQFDFFGTAVSVSGDVAIIGSQHDAYIFTLSEGGSWSQTAKLTSDAAGTDSVSISGSVAIVGDVADDDGGSWSGSAYIFTRSGGNWSQTTKLRARDAAASDFFGHSVSISGDIAIVGANGDDDAGSKSGSAYVFTLSSSGNWSQTAKLTASDAVAGAEFGCSVSISGDVAVVGAYLDDDGGTSSGSAYFFTLTGNWSQTSKFTGSWADWFGYSVSISGDVAIVSAPYNGDTSFSGAIYIFSRSRGNWSETVKLTASDAARLDWFGYSVAIYGDVAIVGAYSDDDGGSASGSAYIFTCVEDNWSQATKLSHPAHAVADDHFGNAVSISGDIAVVGAEEDNGIGFAHFFVGSAVTAAPTAVPSSSPTITAAPSHESWAFWGEAMTASGAADDNFGRSVSISGDVAMVGSPRDDDGGYTTGAVNIFTRLGDSWSQTSKLTGAETSDNFGFAVCVSGGVAIVSALWDESVYIFTQSGANWSQTAKFTVTESDYFGDSVSISGTAAIVGAFWDDEGGPNSGAAYIFAQLDGNWSETVKLIASDASAGERFGCSVSICGNVAIVGASHDDEEAPDSGAVYVFTLFEGSWNQTQKLTASDSAAADYFGESVSLSGDAAIVGAGSAGSGGSAYIFTRSGGKWWQTDKLTPSGANEWFGSSVSVSGVVAIVGAPGDNGIGSHSGSAYVFTRSAVGNWSETTKLTASDSAAGDQFGYSVAVSGDSSIVGAPWKNDSGSAYVFTGTDVTSSPTTSPNPTMSPSRSQVPSSHPSVIPSTTPTHHPSQSPSISPTSTPSSSPTSSPSLSPSVSPTTSPTADFLRFSSQLVISATAERAESIFATDMDNDGDTDVLSASYDDNTVTWYANDGEQNFTEHAITTTAGGAAWVHAADMDGDGDVDVVSAAFVDDTVSWFESDIAAPDNVSFTANVVSSSVDGAVCVLAIDLDRDGDVDVVCAAYDANAVYWHENDGGAQSFTDHVITSAASGALSVFAIDVDSDGDVDVLSASLWDDTVAWHENNGTEGFTRHVISTAADEAWSVYAVDVDGDGDVDVLSASRFDNTVAWYENDGESNFTTRVISDSATSARSVFAVDLDADGDVDVLSALQGADAVEWYENDGSQGFVSHRITESANGARSVYAADVDGDGDVDVLSASYDDDTVAWYRSVGVNTLSPSVSPSSSPSASPSVLPTSAPTYQTWPFWLLQQSVTASDVAVGDDFGSSVAISGDVAIVGAPDDDDSGSSSGSAYIFTLSGDGNWSQTAKLKASNDSASDFFGWSVAISGDVAIVGAYGDEDSGSSSGSAYIFTLSGGGNWFQTAKLTASDAAAEDLFGWSVAISGGVVIVGACYDDDGGSSSGSAYIFTLSGGGNWSENAKLTASDADAYGYFGISVSISNDVAIVGAGNFAYIFTPSGGGNWSQTAKLTASGDYFGRSVAISGDVAIVGAYRDDDGGSASGSAYIFTLSGGGNWSQTAKLTASDADAEDEFGRSVAISGDVAIVGAPYDDDHGSASGSAYIFTLSGGNWSQTAKLTASFAADLFGDSVAISGGVAIVGADQQNNVGYAHFFDGSELTSVPTPVPSTSPSITWAPSHETWDFWLSESKLVASDADAGDNFGWSVAISDDAAIVGAPNDDSGSVYIFTLSDESQTAKLTTSDAGAGDYFGWSVAISDDMAIVGAPYDDSGSVYIFTLAGGGNWSQTAKLTANGTDDDDRFGSSVAISSGVVIVGAPNDDVGGRSNSGCSFVFTLSDGKWSQTAKLTASDATDSDYFGYSVAISGDVAIVGAYGDDDGGYQSGSAYIFTLSGGGNWSQTAKFAASDAAASDLFGRSVAISDDVSIVGAPYDDDGGSDSGSAYIFTLSGGGNWFQTAKLTASDADMDDSFGNSVAISGDVAIVSAPYDDDHGSASGSAYIFTLSDGGSWFETAKLTASDAAASDVFGRSVAIDNDVAIVAAYYDDDGGSNSGAAYLFKGSDITSAPTVSPQPSSAPSVSPTNRPSTSPSASPTVLPTLSPSTIPSPSPTTSPTADFLRFSSQRVISSTAQRAEAVYVADLDHDGDADVLSASYDDDTVAWYANDGEQSFTEHAITTTADGAASVHAADVDGDGDTDVVSAAFVDDTVSWFESDIVAPNNVSFTAHVSPSLSTAPSAFSPSMWTMTATWMW